MAVRVAIISTIGLLLGAGCSSTPLESEIEGLWGGDHITLELSRTRSSLELDCAHGSLNAPVRPDKSGAFTAEGIIVLEHGGPIREDEPEDAHPAVFSGEVVGDRMTLRFEFTDLASPEQSFTLTRDDPGRLMKCL